MQSKTLTALGSYWIGRKPLVLNRACVLASLLPATTNPKADLETFELLMGMDDISLSKRLGLPSPEEIARHLQIADISKYFHVSPADAEGAIPVAAPFEIMDYQVPDRKGRLVTPRLSWREDLDEDAKHRLAVRMLPSTTYREFINDIKRAEELDESLYSHIWEAVNQHLGTNARNHSELVGQLGVMRWGRRPRLADVFSGSGQIPFEAARLGCEVEASDLNPVACMLTWGAFNIVGAALDVRRAISLEQEDLASSVQAEIDSLGVESDGNGWRPKVFLYCLEVLCPSSGWRVPVLPTRLLSKKSRAIVTIEADHTKKNYILRVKRNVSEKELTAASQGTITRNSKFGEAYVTHTVDGVLHRNAISTIRSSAAAESNLSAPLNGAIRMWTKQEFVYRPGDVFAERLYAIQWTKEVEDHRALTEFRSVSEDDLMRERLVEEYVARHIEEWRDAGWIPDFRIEPGAPPRYEGRSLIETRGWTHWHHLFSPRQLMYLGLCRKGLQDRPHSAALAVYFARLADWSSKLCRYGTGAARESVAQTFYNQALNPIYNYGVRPFCFASSYLLEDPALVSLPGSTIVRSASAQTIKFPADLFITDPPYGDAVKYEEIFDFFVGWFRKTPPSDFTEWVWDSRRPLAIKGEDHDFKLGMVRVYKQLTALMPDDGLQIVMFTHQDNAIWVDMANIVWASGLRVSAAWYVVTETDSALRDGQYVKGTILLVLRKRAEATETSRDELAYEIEEEVKRQVEMLTGLNVESKQLYRGENLFEDADLQMAGYAAALRVLTRYAKIDGVSMPNEAMRPRVKDQRTLVDELIEFAVNRANEYLVPDGVDRVVWEKSIGVERFYLKMLDMESKGIHVLSNYQNFAQAFKVNDYGAVMDEVKANHANLKSALQLGKRGMTAGEEFGPTVLRSVLYAVHLLQENKVKPEDVLHQLRDLVPDYFRERERITALADYVSKKTAKARPDESSNAMVLRDLVRRERV